MVIGIAVSVDPISGAAGWFFGELGRLQPIVSEHVVRLTTVTEVQLLRSEVKALFRDAAVPGTSECNAAASYISNVWSKLRFVGEKKYSGGDIHSALYDALEAGAHVQTCKLAIQAYPRHFKPPIRYYTN